MKGEKDSVIPLEAVILGIGLWEQGALPSVYCANPVRAAISWWLEILMIASWYVGSLSPRYVSAPDSQPRLPQPILDPFASLLERGRAAWWALVYRKMKAANRWLAGLLDCITQLEGSRTISKVLPRAANEFE